MQNRIKERREELRMTQEELAAKSNISRQTIHALETGKADNVTLSTMMSIAHALESSTEKIFLP